jgi:hypothetical protein
MRTPAAALAWELWRRHRVRLMSIVGLVLGFALVYPKLCALAGFYPGIPNALDQFTTKIALWSAHGQLPLRVVQNLYGLFLAYGPLNAMILTLLYVVWMFTFTEYDPKTKNLLKFPARLFTLPVSTPFLFWGLWLGGMATVATLYESWIYFVPQPHLLLFELCQSGFGWMTLLTLAQAIIWSLAAWPATRMLLLMAVLFGFLGSLAQGDPVESPILLAPLFFLGFVLARIGMQKMRQGQWQGWTWKWPFAAMSARAELRGPRHFASPAQAQLWFEWRRSGRGLCLIVAALVLVPMVIYLLRVGTGFRPLSQSAIFCLVGYLMAIPLVSHFCFGVSPARTDVPFLMIRPLSNGQMMMAMLKSAAISSIFSWTVVLAALAALPLLGDFRAVEKFVSIPPRYLLVIVPGLILLSWRLIAVNLCFVWSGKRALAGLPVLLFVASYTMAFVLVSNVSETGWMFVPIGLECLIAVKFLLALRAFRVALQRGLLAPSVVACYLVVWTLLAATLLIPATILFHDTPFPFILLLLSGIVLLIPLARIGFCPITLAWNRHG